MRSARAFPALPRSRPRPVQKALTIPIQALTIRQQGDLEEAEKQSPAPPARRRSSILPRQKARKEEIQGVFVIKGEKAEFQKVETGITGSTDIEVVNGLNAGDEMVTGTYKIIRTLRNERTREDRQQGAREDGVVT